MNLREFFETSGVSQQQVADLVGVTQGRVSQWTAGEKVPAERCAALERATGGRVTRYELREDIFGRQPKAQRKAASA